ncbi:ribonuclease H-like domain-containing protein [Jeotgalibacillus sp. R-1-5s-1]|uniref:ribonuclease H-like domain-containing protein n=1 Tax=Jeotgalibacillus sp. R-1-5s-1 TaxID=2555897 RepID=UPI00106CA1EC|nr:ribonuclease H-like domain-containing protein [Jeotgalibacillus sp. R-1-5s-1]TFE03246.1 hypothetical protein E2491_00210 [Jeotgalibacillus sp. R-1-5s-1]
MKPHLKSNSSGAARSESMAEIPHLDLWKQHHTDLFWHENDFCLIREVHFPLNYQHGRYRLSDYHKIMEGWQKANASHSLSSAGYHPEDLFFFDTETTGLRGTGSTIFVLGHARFAGDKVILKQHILPGPGQEIPLYISFLKQVNYKTLVTYNGKSFDWPQVKSRHTLIREHVPKLPQTGHFDLYHASRRLWKGSMASVKLKHVEEQKLGFERKDDLPGYLAPAIYFDFIERKHPEGMIKVLDHNEKDILSLITLYIHLSELLLDQEIDQTSAEKYELGKWYSHEGEREIGSGLLEDAYKMDGHISAAHNLAYLHKKNKQYDQAEKLWLKVSSNGSKKEMVEAAVELAKIYEHQFKNHAYAITMAKKALVLIDSELETKKASDLKHRIKRLEKKQGNL